MSKVWFVTGASSGFGRLWTQAALERGDRVVATARRTGLLAGLTEEHGEALHVLELDVTDRDAVLAAVDEARDRVGRLDVVLNNAGYGQWGMVEELTEQELRDQMETNFFGAAWVTQAAVRVLREQGSGHLVQVTSEGGVRAYPGIGAYHASKWALEGLTDSLAQEAAGLGFHVTCLEPGPYDTGFGGAIRSSSQLAAYDPVREASAGTFTLADPAATVPALLALVDSDRPPRRLVLGPTVAEVIEIHEERIGQWRAWQDVSLAAGG